MTWAGMQRGSTFCGHLPVALGSFVYQIEGNRLLACIDVLECMGLMEDIPEDVTPEMGPDLIKACFVPVFSVLTCCVKCSAFLVCLVCFRSIVIDQYLFSSAVIQNLSRRNHRPPQPPPTLTGCVALLSRAVSGSVG